MPTLASPRSISRPTSSSDRAWKRRLKYVVLAKASRSFWDSTSRASSRTTVGRFLTSVLIA
jgi:hypothetical protein